MLLKVTIMEKRRFYKLKTSEPDVILSDILIPEFSGIQFLNFVQKKSVKIFNIINLSFGVFLLGRDD